VEVVIATGIISISLYYSSIIIYLDILHSVEQHIHFLRDVFEIIFNSKVVKFFGYHEDVVGMFFVGNTSTDVTPPHDTCHISYSFAI